MRMRSIQMIRIQHSNVIAVRKGTHVTIPEGPTRRYSLRIHQLLVRELMHATSSPPLSLYFITFLLSACLLRLPDSQLLRLEIFNHRDARLNGSHLSQWTVARSLYPRYQRLLISFEPHSSYSFPVASNSNVFCLILERAFCIATLPEMLLRICV
jgi:hypothetical protein